MKDNINLAKNFKVLGTSISNDGIEFTGRI